MSWVWAVAAGVLLGVIYTLSPLTVLGTAALIVIVRRGARDLSGRERDWFVILFTVAIALRFIVIGALLVFSDPSRPYGVFFGDEWIFKSRPIWLRNVGLGLPISSADFIYAFDETGRSAHLNVLALLQAIVGDAPYGAHIFNVVVYVGTVAALYHLVRRSFGPAVAFGGSAVLLLMPSLFAWSVSVLKEPSFIAVSFVELVMVLAVVRAPRWWQRVLAAAAVVVLALAMEELRYGSLRLAAIGAIGGLAAFWIVQSPRRIVAAAVVVPAVLVMALAQPRVQERAIGFGRELARYHMGHVMTPGISYKLLDSRYYGSRWIEVRQMGARELLQFVARAGVAYVVEPTPRNVQTRLLWAYLPEHFAWLILIALVPFGLVAAVKRDALLTTVAAAHGAATIMMVALTSGNVGTLIRHRGLVLPYLVWFSCLGAFVLLARVAPRSGRTVNDDHR